MREKSGFSLKKILVSQLFIIIGIFILIFFFVALSKEFLRSYQVNKELQNLQNEILSLEQTNSEFSELITYLQTTDFAEKEARKRFNLKKPGESVVVVENSGQIISQNENSNDSSSKQSTLNNSENTSKVSNPKKWWNYYFGNKL